MSYIFVMVLILLAGTCMVTSSEVEEEGDEPLVVAFTVIDPDDPNRRLRLLSTRTECWVPHRYRDIEARKFVVVDPDMNEGACKIGSRHIKLHYCNVRLLTEEDVEDGNLVALQSGQSVSVQILRQFSFDSLQGDVVIIRCRTTVKPAQDKYQNKKVAT